MNNHYDETDFFDKYSQMTRSKEGLAGAGEWQTLRRLLPDFDKKTVLDLGCGYGWHCKYAADHGAKQVIGVDLSEKMLAEAAKRNADPKIDYRQGDILEAAFPADTFDIVFSSLAFHYLPDWTAMVKRVASYLKSGGTFLFSVEHPVFTAAGNQQWAYDEQGEIRHFPVDRYFYEGVRQADFLGETVEKYHRTLTTYVETLLQNGFSIEHLVEPTPPEDLLSVPGMVDELRRPMMLIISAKKK
ncbi:class I SAM-dependent methyltransferase [Enterococcus sp. AD013-P3]|uniref:class I SAM-dependent methyltransferase n=1 Tax=Enterococcus sp. AD013-P3 TaxID=3411036 RepID=UPI003B9460AE